MTEEIKEKESLGKKPETEVAVWSFGVLLNKFDDLLMALDNKVQKKLYFLEQRQQKMENQNEEIIKILKEIRDKI